MLNIASSTYLTDARRRRRTGCLRPAEQPIPAYYIHRTSESYSSAGALVSPSGEWEKNRCRRRGPGKQGRTRQRSAPSKSFAAYNVNVNYFTLLETKVSQKNSSMFYFI